MADSGIDKPIFFATTPYDGLWEVVKPFRYLCKYGEIEVPPGSLTDFASVPRVFWWLIPKWGKHGKAAVIHDFLYRYNHPLGACKKDADNIFRLALVDLGVHPLKVWVMYLSVRLFGKRRGVRKSVK